MIRLFPAAYAENGDDKESKAGPGPPRAKTVVERRIAGQNREKHRNHETSELTEAA